MANKVLPPLDELDRWRYSQQDNALAKYFPEHDVVVVVELSDEEFDGETTILYLYTEERPESPRRTFQSSLELTHRRYSTERRDDVNDLLEYVEDVVEAGEVDWDNYVWPSREGHERYLTFPALN